MHIHGNDDYLITDSSGYLSLIQRGGQRYREMTLLSGRVDRDEIRRRLHNLRDVVDAGLDYLGDADVPEAPDEAPMPERTHASEGTGACNGMIGGAR